jgi:hypothetical protein
MTAELASGGGVKGEAIIASVFLIGSFALFAVAIILTEVCGRLPGWFACTLCAAVKQFGLGGRKRQYAGLPDLCLALRSVPLSARTNKRHGYQSGWTPQTQVRQ